MQALGDIEIAMRVLKDCGVTENPVDSHYKALNCELRLMDRTDPMFKVLLVTAIRGTSREKLDKNI